MINIGFGPNILLGGLLCFGVLILYFLRTIKYDLSRDIDVFFTTLGFIYASIIIVHGWRLDPILLFSQILIMFILLAICWENIRLRGLTSQNIKNYDDDSSS